jgi:uncharacterized protein
VPAVLAVYNWPKNSDRYRRVQRFAEGMFNKWNQFREAPRHPKWRDVNLAATVPGWTRWSVAADMLRQLNPPEEAAGEAEFAAFLRRSGGGATVNLTQEQSEALFREFLQWKEGRPGAGGGVRTAVPRRR